MSQTNVPPLPPAAFPSVLEAPWQTPRADAPAPPPPDEPAKKRPSIKKVARSPLRALGRFALASTGWIWCWLVGSAMCFNFFVLSWFTAIVAVGWTNRLVQAVVLRAWWWRSDIRKSTTFAEFCDSLGPDAPTPRPRWFVQERPLAHLRRPVPTGLPSSSGLVVQLLCWLRLWFQVTFGLSLKERGEPGPITKVLRALCWPWHSLWLNFKVGFLATFCTFTLLGLPCLLMCWSWGQGWINSFHGGYEQAFLGIGLGVVGSLLFAATMLYVPMAQTHQAVTGKARAFFEFHFVWQLVKARLSWYLGLALAVGFWSLMLNAARNAPAIDSFAGNRAPNAEEGLWLFQLYLIQLSLVMFPVYVALRVFAALVYQSAVLKALRQGTITYQELHPVLRNWHEALNLKIVPRAETVGVGWAARLVVSVAYRRALLFGLYGTWILFVVRFYVGTFFLDGQYSSFLNHPLIQIPCFDFIPLHLYQGQDF